MHERGPEPNVRLAPLHGAPHAVMRESYVMMAFAHCTREVCQVQRPVLGAPIYMYCIYQYVLYISICTVHKVL